MAIIQIFAQYWTDKFFLLRYYGRPDVTGRAVAETMVRFYQNAIFFFTGGQLLWDVLLREELSWASIVFLVFTAFIHVTKISSLVDLIVKGASKAKGIDREKLKLAESQATVTYDDCRINFLMEYNRSNPFTAHNANRDWMKYLKCKRPELFDTNARIGYVLSKFVKTKDVESRHKRQRMSLMIAMGKLTEKKKTDSDNSGSQDEADSQ